MSLANTPDKFYIVLPEDPILTPETQTALWERESGRCCVSGWKHDLQPTYIVPPSIVDDEDLLPGVCFVPSLL